ncbi:MAG TPA: hypothetical protein VHZ76_10625 [Gammaproteobacteria bacterium]|jgi:hypothetical protein|nr:hypothetical protein [Gammaproteobacteria bacterium]
MSALSGVFREIKLKLNPQIYTHTTIMRIINIKKAIAVREKQDSSYVNALAQLRAASQKKQAAFAATKRAPAKEAARKKFDALPSNAKARLSHAVKKIEKNWYVMRSQDTLFFVNPNGLHDLSVAHLLNAVKTAKKNLNAAKQQQLLAALNKNAWDDPIFTDEYCIQTAMAVFASGKITYRQMETFIGRYQAMMPLTSAENFPVHQLKTYPIINAAGQLTEAAQRILIPNLAGFLGVKHYSKQMIKTVRFLIQAFSEKCPSENNFYTYKIHPLERERDRLAGKMHSYHNYHVSLYDKNDKSNPAYSDWRASLVNIELSSSAYEAFHLARFDCDHQVVVPNRVLIGKLDLPDIEKGARCVFPYRPQAGDYPEVEIGKVVHGYKEEEGSATARVAHDRLHAIILSELDVRLRKTLLRFATIIQMGLLVEALRGTEHQDRLFSVAVWYLIDAFFSNIEVDHVFISPKEEAEQFSKKLMHKSRKKVILLDENKKITDSGILCLMDMARNKKIWHKDIEFFPEYMTGELKKYFKIAEYIVQHIVDKKIETPIFSILLYRVYLTSKRKSEFLTCAKEIGLAYPELAVRFACHRNNKIKFLGVVDRENKGLPIENSVEKIIQAAKEIATSKAVTSEYKSSRKRH